MAQANVASPDPGLQLLALVRNMAAELHPAQLLREIDLSSRLNEDVGLDSLGRVELLGRVEEAFAVKLPETAVAELETVGDLLQCLRQATPGGVPLAQTPVKPLTEQTAGAVPGNQLATLADVLAWHVAHHGARQHIRFYGSENAMSYTALLQGAETVAAALQGRLVAPGQRVGLLLPTGREFFLSFFGCLLAGAVPVPLYPPDRRTHLAEYLQRQAGILDNAEAVLMITFAEAERAAHLVRGKVASLADVVTAASLLQAETTQPRMPIALQADDIAMLQYTSGSTGAPKGVVLTHAQLLANIRAMGVAIQASPDDVFVSWLPLYHDMGLIGAWLGSLNYAMPLVLMSPLTFLGRPERWLRAIHEYRGTLSASPNFGYELCLRKIKDEALAGLDLSSWRVAFNGAEPVSADTLDRFCRRFAQCGFKRSTMAPVYGLAESAVGLAFPPLGREPRIDRVERNVLVHDGEAKPSEDAAAMAVVGCGLPLAGYQIRVVDEHGYELPERRQGRIQFRGPSATSGYFHNPQASAELLCGGWLDTGDLGYVSAGEVFLTSRAKDMIIRAGRNLYPQELEEAVGSLEDIRKGCVAVFACPDVHSGTERLVVVAETNERDEARRIQLRTRIDQLTHQLLDIAPDDIVLARRHAVLKTSSGKLRRAATRDAYLQGRLGAETSPWQARLALARLTSESAWRTAMREAAKWLFAGRCWTVFSLGGVLLLPALALLPDEVRRARFAHHLARLAARACGMDLRISGLEQIPAGTGCIYVCNHSSYLDGLVLMAALPPPFRFTAKKELASDLLLGFVLGRIGTQFIERFDIRESLSDAERLEAQARAGHSLVFFPEGTLSRVPGLRPFHAGAFKVAADAGLQVVPVVLRGTRSMLRDGQWLPLRGPLSVTVLAALKPVGQDWQSLIALRDQAHATILQHCGEPDLVGMAGG